MGKIPGPFGILPAVIAVATQAEPLIEKAIEKHKEFIEEHICLPDVIDMNVKEAQVELEEKGFKVVAIEAPIAKKKYANRALDVVVDMKPRPTPIQKHFLPETLVKIYYVDQKIIEESKELLKQVHEKNKERKRIMEKKLNI